MDSQIRTEPQEQGDRRAAGWDRLRRDESWIPTASVVAVAIVAVVATVIVPRSEVHQGNVQAVQPPAQHIVVRAPPLVVKAPPVDGRPPLHSMGAGAACSNCGVIQTVTAKKGGSAGQAVGYLMDIRMDDGTVLTVEHRGALPAGSRVVVEGETVRLAQQAKD